MYHVSISCSFSLFFFISFSFTFSACCCCCCCSCCWFSFDLGWIKNNFDLLPIFMEKRVKKRRSFFFYLVVSFWTNSHIRIGSLAVCRSVYYIGYNPIHGMEHSMQSCKQTMCAQTQRAFFMVKCLKYCLIRQMNLLNCLFVFDRIVFLFGYYSAILFLLSCKWSILFLFHHLKKRQTSGGNWRTISFLNQVC